MCVHVLVSKGETMEVWLLGDQGFQPAVCVDTCETVCTSNWSGAMVLGALISRWQDEAMVLLACVEVLSMLISLADHDV